MMLSLHKLVNLISNAGALMIIKYFISIVLFILFPKHILFPSYTVLFLYQCMHQSCAGLRVDTSSAYKTKICFISILLHYSIKQYQLVPRP